MIHVNEDIDACETELYDLEERHESRYKKLMILAEKKIGAEFCLECAKLEKDILREDASATALKADLSNTPKTIPLVDKFLSSDFDFLILNHQFALTFPGKWSSWVSLIIAKTRVEYYRNELRGDFWVSVDYEDSDLTLTKLKRNARTFINTEQFLKNIDRYYPYLKGVADVFGKQAPKSPLSQDRVFFLENYIALNAQSSEERTGYGSYTEDGNLVQGTLYGETRSFMIVGCIYRKSHLHL